MSIAKMPSVIIVGAGVAGLSAAHELDRAGYRIEIVEATSRAGGRIQTIRDAFADGMYAEAGPLSVPDNHFHVLRYLHEFDLPFEPASPPVGNDLISVHRCRTMIGSATHCACLDLTQQERQLGYKGIFKKYLEKPAKNLGDPAQPDWPPKRLWSLDAISAADFFKSEGASDGALDLLRLGLLDLYGEGLESCSALFILACERLLLGSTHDYEIYGGMDVFPTRLAAPFRDTIHFGSAVTEIEQTGTEVIAHFMQAGRREALAADFLICAIPFPALRKIDVRPPFSQATQEAIDGLENTSVSRVYLQTRSRFWEREKLSGLAKTDLGVMLLLSAYGRASQRGILESYTTGANARRLRDMSPQQRNEFTIREVGKVFPEIHSQVENITYKSWDLDPYEGGAYAFFRPGQFLPFLSQLASPEGRIFFAGDQTSMLPGWMEGAIQSGLRATAQIQEMHRGEPSLGPTPQAGCVQAVRGRQIRSTRN